MSKRAEDILKHLTLEEKAGLCSGDDFWNLKSIDRLGLENIMVADGPHGLRKHLGDHKKAGLLESYPATCFPTASASACSWNRELIYRMGIALGEECLKERVSVILGPGANIKRSPLCGRNFEYISEDPYLTGALASAQISGIQSTGVGTALKHFAMNNQESRRMVIDAVVDERTRREIYLAGFETAVKEARPWTVMCSYNKADGTYLSEHKKLLTDILKEEWGHKGITMTDWGACNDRVEGIKAGLDLEMPTSWGLNDKKIIDAVTGGHLEAEDLDRAVIRVIDLILKSMENRKTGFTYDIDSHHKLAAQIEGESAVLLKNKGILPFVKNEKIALIGEFAIKPRYQGAGSSMINPHRTETLYEAFRERGVDFKYSQGYDIKTDKPDYKLIMEAKKTAAEADKVVIIAGLTESYETEGSDRCHLGIPMAHNMLISEVSLVNSNIVVILMNGSPVEMPWLGKVKGVLEAYLCGQAGCGALADICLGTINPSGKLAESFPLKLSDTPSNNYFPGGTKTVEYRESIYVGYRYYDKAFRDVKFPFGFGLSYTTFEYSNILIKGRGNYEYDVIVTIKNTGDRAGAEIVQLYVENPESNIFRAVRELRDFGKVCLKPGESKDICLKLNERSFAFYNKNIPGWHVEGGNYKIQAASSSRDIRLEKTLWIEANTDIDVPDYRQDAPIYYSLPEGQLLIDDEQFEALYGKKLPPRDIMPGEPLTVNSLLKETRRGLAGRLIAGIITLGAVLSSGKGDGAGMRRNAVKAMILETPVRSIGVMAGDRLPRFFAEGLVAMADGNFFKGLGLMMKRK